MAALDTWSDRYYWGIGNLVLATFCIPICYSLPSKDAAFLKFATALGGATLSLNSARLLSEHSETAGLRTAWRTCQEMVSGAWIEQIAQSNLPPIYQAPVYQPAKKEFATGYLPPLQFQMAAPPPSPEDLPDRGDGRTNYGEMPELSWYPSLLGYGMPGAGKTTFIEQEVCKRLVAGHEVIVLDPHAAYGQWKNCEVIGGGMDYKAIDAKMVWFKDEIARRYKIRQTQPNPEFKPLTIVAEEFMNWAARCKNSTEHFFTVNSDIRKIECFSIIVTHTRTLKGLGNAEGLASLRDESMLEVELLGIYNPVTKRATPRFEALVKMPGQALSDRTLVKIERHSGKLPQQPIEPSDRAPKSSTEASSPEPENPGSLARIPGVDFEAIYAQVVNSGGKFPAYGSDWGASDAERFELAKLVVDRIPGIEKRILYLWGVTSGGEKNHQKYRLAREWLDRLIEQINNSGGSV